MMDLDNPPELCDRCGARGSVLESRSVNWWRRRRLECPTCSDPGGEPYRWTSWESRLSPREVLFGPERHVETKPR
jgi:hypothetical protein